MGDPPNILSDPRRTFPSTTSSTLTRSRHSPSCGPSAAAALWLMSSVTCGQRRRRTRRRIAEAQTAPGAPAERASAEGPGADAVGEEPWQEQSAGFGTQGEFHPHPDHDGFSPVIAGSSRPEYRSRPLVGAGVRDGRGPQRDHRRCDGQRRCGERPSSGKLSGTIWMRYGIPTSPLTTTVASGLYALLFSLMRW